MKTLQEALIVLGYQSVEDIPIEEEVINAAEAIRPLLGWKLHKRNKVSSHDLKRSIDYMDRFLSGSIYPQELALRCAEYLGLWDEDIGIILELAEEMMKE